MLHKKARGFFYSFLFSFAFSTKTDRFFVKLVHSSHIFEAFSSDISLSPESAVSIFNALADLSGTDSQTLHLPSQVIARLTPDQISIATNKNWSVTTTK